MSLAQDIALWADKLRDLSAQGLRYADNSYDRERYETLQSLALEMTERATGEPTGALEPLRDTLFRHIGPLSAAAGAVINPRGDVLLMQRADNRLWSLPGGMLEVGETAAAGMVLEVFEETGVRCRPMTLVGVYDSRLWGRAGAQHVYAFTFLAEPLAEGDAPSHAHESLGHRWFPEDSLPDDLYPGHVKRLEDAFRVWRGDIRPHFDP